MYKIPLVAQWNLYSGCVCTPDGGFLYAGSRSINFINAMQSDNETPIIQCFHTRQGILSLDIDPHWGQKESNVDASSNENLDDTASGGEKVDAPAKLFSALLQDNSVQIWDFNKGCAIQGHKAHLAYRRYLDGNGPSPQNCGNVFISYMCNRNVLSIDNHNIIVYCVASNSYYRRPLFFSLKNHQMTSLKCSPYSENFFAIGTKRGLVMICDLQQMTILYNLKRHATSITSLSWNRFEASTYVSNGDEKKQESIEIKTVKTPQSKLGKLTRSDATINSNDIFDIYNYDYLENEFGAPQDRKKANGSPEDYVGIEKPKEATGTAQFDFAEACESLKEEMNSLRNEQTETPPEHMISLDECKQAAKHRNNISISGSEYEVDDQCRSDKESSECSSVRPVCRTPSSESVDIDGMYRNKQNFICQADVHQIDQSQDNEKLQNTENPTETVLVEKDEEERDTNCKESKETTYDILLASSSADGSFCVFNAATGATCDAHIVRSNHGRRNKNVEISWISSTSLVLNNSAGALELWTIEPPTNDKLPRLYKFKETSRDWPQRSVVSLATLSSQHILWTLSSHREIYMEDILLNKKYLNYVCVSTNIGAMEECPDNMNKIALGFSDHRIGILDISKMTPTSVYIENFANGIESLVMSLVWSPDCRKIAFGTMEGQIGTINIEGQNKQPFIYNSICGKPIYCLKWQDKFLYVVCNDCIAVYEDDSSKTDPFVISGINNVSSISVRDNYLFVGTQSGHLKLYVHKENTYFQYKLKVSLELANRYITDISWSPIVTNKLAVVANVNAISILEFNSDTADLVVTRKITLNSTNHCCVKWSNRNENYFLTCGLDGAVRIWDLSKDENPEVFVKTYHCPMNCGLFFPTDEQIVICSGKNAALEFIDMRLEKTEKPGRSKPKIFVTENWATRVVTQNESQPEKQNPPFSDTVSTMFGKMSIENTTESCIYMKNPATLLYLTTRELNKNALDLMLSCLTTSKTNTLMAKLYGTKTDAKEILMEEIKNYDRSQIKGIPILFMHQLNGSLKDEIIKCVQSKQLSEWHVSLAPTISYNFWQKCSEAFAEQLLDKGHPIQAVSYLLAIHQQREAISLLMKKKFFKEAALVARAYLQSEDVLLDIITEEWLTHLCAEGNLTGAAFLCLVTKQNQRAYECLTKIRNNNIPNIERVIRLLKASVA